MRGLMAKPKKSTAGGGEIVKTRFFLTLGRSFYLRVFISTHGARKGLADTA
jgi:DNA-directed RNA polymerase subunit beta'